MRLLSTLGKVFLFVILESLWHHHQSKGMPPSINRQPLASPSISFWSIFEKTKSDFRDRIEDLLPRSRPPPTPPKVKKIKIQINKLFQPSSTRDFSTCDDESTCPPSTIQINTFGEGPLRRFYRNQLNELCQNRSLTNLAIKNSAASGDARELFSRADSIALSSNSSVPSKSSKSASHRRLLSMIPDEVCFRISSHNNIIQGWSISGFIDSSRQWMSSEFFKSFELCSRRRITAEPFPQRPHLYKRIRNHSLKSLLHRTFQQVNWSFESFFLFSMTRETYFVNI